MRDCDVSTVERAYQNGLRLARDGRFFDAHEAFETAWRACGDEERDFFQGLVHVVVSAYQHGRDRPVATERQRLKALRRSLDRAEADPRQHLVDRRAQPPVAVEEEQQSERDEHRA